MGFRCIWLKPQYICRQYEENSLSSLLNQWKKVMLYAQEDVMQDPVCLCLWPNHIHANIVQTYSCGMIFDCLTLFWNWKTTAKESREYGLEFVGSRGLKDRALDLKPEVTQGCGFESRLWQKVSTTEVSKAPNPQLLPRRRSAAHCSRCVCTWMG